MRTISVRATDDSEQVEAPATRRIVRLPDSNAVVVHALRAREPAGAARLFDRYYAYVRRILSRLLGPDPEIADVVQEVFLAAINSIDRLRDPDALKTWMGQIAVNRARKRLRQRTRQRLFDLFPADEPPTRADPQIADPEVDEAVRATYRVLDAMPTEDRLVFALRFIDGCEIAEIAALYDSSVSTIKRRVARAASRFAMRARREPALEDYLVRASWIR
jgi:RNA polymerase sigma-70 factor (ECF subfamily)